MTAQPARRFLVSRDYSAVTIREIGPQSEAAHSFTRREAWEHANREARPAKRSQDPKRREYASIYFVGLNMERSTIATAEMLRRADETEAAAERRKLTADDIAPGTGEPEVQAPLRGRIADEDVVERNREAIAVADLRAQVEAGRANDFVESLLSQYERRGNLTPRQIDAVIRGMEKRDAAKSSGPIPDVPAGRYAVENAEGELRFYVVDRPEEGRWKDYTFVKVLASDTEHRVPMGAAKVILAEIQKDPRAASIRYGRELGKCGVCNRTLTDEASRAAGIGPVCAERF